jgi:hypothetical protein
LETSWGLSVFGRVDRIFRTGDYSLKRLYSSIKMTDYSFLDPDLPRYRLTASSADVVIDVKKYLDAKKISRNKISKSEYFKWEKAKYKYQVFDRITNWNHVCAELGLQSKKVHVYSDEDVVKHYLNVAEKYQKLPSKALFKLYAIEERVSMDYAVVTKRWGAKNFSALIYKYSKGEISLPAISNAKLKKIQKKSISARLRAEVLKRDNYKCVKCGADPKDGDTKLHAGHKIHDSHGGPATLENLEAQCANCNLGISNVIIDADT